MKRLLGCLLLMGIAGCAGAGPIAELENLGAKIKRNEQGAVVRLSLAHCKITDTGLVQLKGMANLEKLMFFGCPGITEQGVANLRKALPKCSISQVR